MIEIKINVVEASSELASLRTKEVMELRLKERLGVKHLSDKDIETYMYVKESKDSFIYTDEAQDVFNSYYDMYYEILTNSKIDNND